jgi:catechol 2,3-dioxygenase-like lactoylglutathione lyase family enzyme
MFKDTPAFSGFSVDNLAAARTFYSEVLGLDVVDDMMGLKLNIPGTNGIFIYPKKDDHKPASYTILNFPVTNIEAAVSELAAKGVKFERYPEMLPDDKGIVRGTNEHPGPDIAWFKDPAGNILSVLQNK